MPLPPGQRAIEGFPRFGTHMNKPAPAVPAQPTLEITGAVRESFTVPLEDLARLPRHERTADFHCVAGWSATGLRWEGVAFEALYRALIEPTIEPGAVITHIGFGGLDGYRSVATIEDALAEDVLVAERLDGRPLDSDHGAPLRLVSPSQYGFISTKHLCRIELMTSEPSQGYGSATAFSRVGLRLFGFDAPSRARVWEEERGSRLPIWLARPVFRFITPPIRYLSARGSRSGDGG
jgi:DMSO/TMAO reductase YedYZ molybdopterin-dependent catalytic subunit